MHNQLSLLHPSQHQKLCHASGMLSQVWTPQPHLLSWKKHDAASTEETAVVMLVPVIDQKGTSVVHSCHC